MIMSLTICQFGCHGYLPTCSLVSIVILPHAVAQTSAVLSMAGATADEAVEGISGLISENSELIVDIDKLIVRVSRTHNLVKKINSPTSLVSENSYLILQPPPNRLQSDDSILVDTIDIYIFFDDVDYPTPALVFYAGPVSDNPGDELLSSGDYIAITIEQENPNDINNFNSIVSLLWRVGQGEGILEVTLQFDFTGEIYVTRVGSQFELQVGQSDNALTTTEHRRINSTVSNDSLLFHVTPQTEYLIGGRPSNASLALNETEYQSFEVEYNLLLINGELWSLWDYSKRSNTDFLSGFFNFHDAAFKNVWLRASQNLVTNFVLSFDGSGYLKPSQFIDSTVDTTGDTTAFVTIYILPLSVSGLVLYLYDETSGLSVEVALVDGSVAIMYNGDIKNSRMLTGADFDATNGLTIGVVYSPVHSQIVNPFITDTEFIGAEFLKFSPDTQAWLGGVKESELKPPFVPKLTNESFRGCLDITYTISDISFFQQSIIRSDYLGPNAILMGVSGTCLATVSALGVWYNYYCG